MIEIMNMNTIAPSEPYDVRIDGVFSSLGNPFVIRYETMRDYVCNRYQQWFDCQVIDNPAVIGELNGLITLYETFGKLRLFCWCYPKRCHAETIKKWLKEHSELNGGA